MDPILTRKPTRMSQEVSKRLVNGLFHLLTNGMYWGYNPLIVTFDPNFLGHPSSQYLVDDEYLVPPTFLVPEPEKS